MTSRRIVARAPATLTLRVAEGVSGVSVTVTDAAGITRLEDVAADVENGVASVELAAGDLPDPTLLEVVWNLGAGFEITHHVDVAGGRYLTPDDVRNREPEGTGTNRPRFTDELLDRAITVVEDRIENRHATGVAWVPRYGRWRLTPMGSSAMQVRAGLREILSATIDGREVDPSRFSWTDHVLDLGYLFPTPTVVELEVLHGRDFPPADLVDAAADAVRSLAAGQANSRVPSTADSMSGGGISFNFSHQADLRRGRPFGLPDVDAVVMSHAVGMAAVG